MAADGVDHERVLGGAPRGKHNVASGEMPADHEI